MISERAMQQAVRAWTRRHSGDWLDADETALQAWLAESEDHREAYGKVARAWDLAGELTMIPRQQGAPEVGTERGVATRAAPRRLVLAACVALLAVASLLLGRAGYSWWNGDPVHWVTAKGRPKSFTLSDGTRVLLDADSELIARIGARCRDVSLIRGEARFSVSHDAAHPFEVTTGAGHVRDLGTRFDIEALADSTRVAVLEGRVGVLTPRGQTLLAAGQTGGYDAVGNLRPPGSLDPAAAHWPEGQRHFDREPLGAVLDRLVRYHPVQFVLTDPGLKELRVSGTFGTADLRLFLRTLSVALPIEVRYSGSQRIEIIPREPPTDAQPRSNAISDGQH
ncbi:MAG TPA: FecR domain-containing protein [Steroidobacteraceae bacterium]|nr:FecR domain-containing protein [Steroidobacteraceae bacterium]